MLMASQHIQNEVIKNEYQPSQVCILKSIFHYIIFAGNVSPIGLYMTKVLVCCIYCRND